MHHDYDVEIASRVVDHDLGVDLIVKEAGERDIRLQVKLHSAILT